MAENDEPLVLPQDLALALSLLTRLPVPASDTSRNARAAWAYPLAGIAVASFAALAGCIAHASGLPAPFTALISLTILVVTTGAMHEDGLADTADGLWGGWTRERRLEIMKDSRIGAYGVIALFLSLSARWAALWMLFEIGAGTAALALIVTAALSRATMPVLMTVLPHARETGLSQSVGKVEKNTALLAAAIGLITAILLLGTGAIPVVFWAVIVTAAIGAIARSKIGGQTGDILGATQQIAEIAILFSILA